MMVFGVLSIPLNVIAIMHLWGWEWWSALIAAAILGCIPVVGQIGFLVLAVMGGYFLVSANFNWREAVNPVNDLSPERFNSYKESVYWAQYLTGKDRSDFVVGAVNSCVGSKDIHPLTSRLPMSFVEQYCRCYANGLADHVSIRDLEADDPAVTGPMAQAEAKRCYESQMRGNRERGG
jgi:hypothetical protein